MLLQIAEAETVSGTDTGSGSGTDAGAVANDQAAVFYGDNGEAPSADPNAGDPQNGTDPSAEDGAAAEQTPEKNAYLRSLKSAPGMTESAGRTIS